MIKASEHAMDDLYGPGIRVIKRTGLALPVKESRGFRPVTNRRAGDLQIAEDRYGATIRQNYLDRRQSAQSKQAD